MSLKTTLRNAAVKVSSSTNGDFRQQVRLGNACRDSGNFSAAATHYRAALGIRRDHPGIWVQLGNMFKDCGKFADAEEAYRESLKLQPNCSDTYLQVGHLMNVQGRRQDAIARYETALKLDSKNLHAFAALSALEPGSRLLNEANDEIFTTAERLDIQDVVTALRSKHADGFTIFQDQVFRSASFKH